MVQVQVTFDQCINVYVGTYQIFSDNVKVLREYITTFICARKQNIYMHFVFNVTSQLPYNGYGGCLKTEIAETTIDKDHTGYIYTENAGKRNLGLTYQNVTMYMYLSQPNVQDESLYLQNIAVTLVCIFN